MDWAIVGTGVATAISGGALGCAVTWHVANKQLEFEREKHANERRDAHGERLAPLAVTTLSHLKATDTLLRGMAVSDEARGVSVEAYGKLLDHNLWLLDEVINEWAVAGFGHVASGIEDLTADAWSMLRPERIEDEASRSAQANRCLRTSEDLQVSVVSAASRNTNLGERPS